MTGTATLSCKDNDAFLQLYQIYSKPNIFPWAEKSGASGSSRIEGEISEHDGRPDLQLWTTGFDAELRSG